MSRRAAACRERCMPPGKKRRQRGMVVFSPFSDAFCLVARRLFAEQLYLMHAVYARYAPVFFCTACSSLISAHSAPAAALMMAE